ncbi:hypothetical protein HPC49_23560 [Pyxidicoccus fallax]|uniref:Uncharacterized protein n=1 Tax=Pyxidicoccus fallax TaxID=394095 RepID=A0A848LY87_9BACT|nr:hypothetical protein [Pyxidicoccus fallax]NMO23045.1 hypothetical protein [Pyxidicoccus fallax]NPC81193.1 hypothetical protein [Pyxidicoccus fallax]
MSRFLRGLLTFLSFTVLAVLTLLLVGLLTGGALSAGVALSAGLVLGGGYGLQAGVLGSYDLGAGKGWLELLVDATWSLPNTLFGFVLGNLIYPWFGDLSRSESEGRGWVVYKATGPGTGFGHDVLQTLGTVNLGGAGNHERVHVLQARILGPLYLPFVALSYVLTFTLQVLWTVTVGGLLKLLGARDTPYFRPPARSAVGGFFGWVYYATPIELWAYSTESH